MSKTAIEPPKTVEIKEHVDKLKTEDGRRRNKSCWTAENSWL